MWKTCGFPGSLRSPETATFRFLQTDSVLDWFHPLLKQAHGLSTVVKDPRRTKTTIHKGAVRLGQENGYFVLTDRTRSDPYLPESWRELHHVYGFGF